MVTEIEEGQKLVDGDCIYNLTRQQLEEIIEITGESTNDYDLDGLVFNGGELFPTYMEYCAELEEYEFEDFKQLCINTYTK